MELKSIKIAIIIAAVSVALIFAVVKIAIAPSEYIVQFWPETASLINTETNYSLPEPELKSVELIFGGDVMLSRQVNSRMAKYNDYTWPFLKIADFLQSADITIINLESPFSITADYFVPTGSFTFKTDPQAVAGLVLAGVDMVSLANNHALNQGQTGLKKTFQILNDQGIEYIGAGNNEEEARAEKIITINSQNFSFLAYAYPNDSSVATSNKAGIANMDVGKMVSDIQKLKMENKVIIVIMHAGTEYTLKPNWQQVEFAQAAIEAGAEAVIGHHPHWPQAFEFYQDKPIIYSLGNLVFDQMFSLETRQGLLAKMSWKNGWDKIELVPIKIYDYGQAEIIQDEAERKSIFKKIGAPENGVILEN